MSEGQQGNEETQKIEKEARLMGWVPKEDFRDGDHWVDAETFVQRGKEINPILRKNNENLLKKLDEATREVAEVKKVAKEFEVFQKEATERKVADLEKQLKELKNQKKEAITAADGDLVVELDEAIDVVKEQQAAAKKVADKPVASSQEPVVLDPLVVNWMEDNKWFTTDLKMTRIADAIGASINAEFPNLRGQAFFDKLDEELKETFPEKFGKTSRQSPVEGNTDGTRRPANKNKKSYENLPADAKAACDKFVKQGFMTRENYVAEYEWE